MRHVMQVGAGVVTAAAAIVAGSHEVSGSLRVYEIAPAK